MIRALSLVLAATAICRADLQDPFHQAQGQCSYSFSAPYSACDVIGDQNKYDIQSASFDRVGEQARIDLYFNYGGGSLGSPSLAPFNDGLELAVGDLFFYNPFNASKYLFGLPLADHTTGSRYLAGALYQIGGTVTTATADNLLHNGAYYYRRNEIVWLAGAGADPIAQGTVEFSANDGDGVVNAFYHAQIEFTGPPGFWDTVARNDEIGIAFSSATCGNDVIKGSLQAVPEPASVIAFGTILIVLMPLMKRRKRSPHTSK